MRIIATIGWAILFLFIITQISKCDVKTESTPEPNPLGTVGMLHVKIIVIDNCEYLQAGGSTNSAMLTHKGNCRFCELRRKNNLTKN